MLSYVYQHYLYLNLEFLPNANAIHSETDGCHRFYSFQITFHDYILIKPRSRPHLNCNHIINLSEINEMCENRIAKWFASRRIACADANADANTYSIFDATGATRATNLFVSFALRSSLQIHFHLIISNT